MHFLQVLRQRVDLEKIKNNIDFLYRDDEENNPSTLTPYVQDLEKNKKGSSIYIVIERQRENIEIRGVSDGTRVYRAE